MTKMNDIKATAEAPTKHEKVSELSLDGKQPFYVVQWREKGASSPEGNLCLSTFDLDEANYWAGLLVKDPNIAKVLSPDEAKPSLLKLGTKYLYVIALERRKHKAEAAKDAFDSLKDFLS